MNQTSTIAQALPIVAAAFGRKFGVQVEVGGDRAYTDGQIIRLPEIHDTPLAKTLAWGYLAHEAAHVRYTDFEVKQNLIAAGLIDAVDQILEDVRIENAIIGAYPGTRGTLDALIQWALEQGKTSAPKAGDSPPMVLGKALLVMTRHRYRQQVFLKDVAVEAERVLRKTFPPSFVYRLLGLLTEVPGLHSTRDAADLAKRIVALIQDEAKDPPPPPEPAEASAQDDEGQGGAEGQEDPNGADQERDDGHAQDDGTEAGTESAQDGDDPGQEAGQSADTAGEGADTSPGHAQAGPSSDAENDADQPGIGAGGDGGDGRKALRAVLAAGAGDLPEDALEAVAKALETQANACGRYRVLMPSTEDYAGNAIAGQAALARVRGESAKLTARLQGLVEAHQMTKTRAVRRGRALSPTALHRVAVGDDRIFVRHDRRVAPNTAMHLLIDLSGSMGGFQDRIALDAATALALALEPMRGVSCAVTAFPSLDGQDNRVTRILSHGDRVARKAGAFVQCGRGGTPMTGALWYAAADLLARREERKVIMTLTDGGPDDFDSAKDMVRKAAAAGVEMIGVGIATRVDRLFPVAITIGAVTDLKGQLFGIAEQLLLR